MDENLNDTVYAGIGFEENHGETVVGQTKPDPPGDESEAVHSGYEENHNETIVAR